MATNDGKADASEASTVPSPRSSENFSLGPPETSWGIPPSESPHAKVRLSSLGREKQQTPRTSSQWMRNYQLFIFAWSLNTGAATTSFDLEVFVLNRKVFGLGTALLNMGVIVASFVAGWAINALGPRRGSAIGFVGLVIYLALITIAAAVGVRSIWQWPLTLVGSVFCGSGVALLGAGLGPMADRTAVAVCKELPGSDYAAVSAKVLVTQAIFSNGSECVMMLILTILQVVLHVSELWIIVLMATLCFCSVGLVLFSRDPPVDEDHEGADPPSIREGGNMLLRFYKDPRAFLLAIYPLALSCLSAWKTAGLTSILKITLGEKWVGVIMIIQTVSTILFAKLAQLAINRMGNLYVMAFGASACITGPLLYILTDLAFENWWILVFYYFVGLVWAVHETAFRGLVLEHFRGQMASIAFASMTMLTNCGGMIFYILDFIQSPEKARAAPGKSSMATLQAVLVVVLGLLVMPSILLAKKYKPTEEDDVCRSPKKEEGFDTAGSPEPSMA